MERRIGAGGRCINYWHKSLVLPREKNKKSAIYTLIFIIVNKKSYQLLGINLFYM